ncbi:DUF1616 domain-containing protein [Dehalococcoidia bacterium]|nr:DUF1616 domain-containing protein [Dehalococcoidia bacterium]
MDLLVVIFLTLLLIPVTYFIQIEPMRMILGVILVLFSPGYALVSTLFPRVDRFGTIERIALSVGLSLITVAILGLILNFTPFGIKQIPFTTTLIVWTISFSTYALVTRTRIGSEDRAGLSFGSVRTRALIPSGIISWILTISVLIAATIFIATLISKIQLPPENAPLTEFYASHQIDGEIEYPTELTLGIGQDYPLTIVNRENQVAEYSIEITLDNQGLGAITIASDLPEKIVLENNETWEGIITVVPLKEGPKQNLSFALYKSPVGTIYRSLNLIITVREE